MQPNYTSHKIFFWWLQLVDEENIFVATQTSSFYVSHERRYCHSKNTVDDVIYLCFVYYGHIGLINQWWLFPLVTLCSSRIIDENKLGETMVSTVDFFSNYWASKFALRQVVWSVFSRLHELQPFKHDLLTYVTDSLLHLHFQFRVT